MGRWGALFTRSSQVSIFINCWLNMSKAMWLLIPLNSLDWGISQNVVEYFPFPLFSHKVHPSLHSLLNLSLILSFSQNFSFYLNSFPSIVHSSNLCQLSGYSTIAFHGPFRPLLYIYRSNCSALSLCANVWAILKSQPFNSKPRSWLVNTQWPVS